MNRITKGAVMATNEERSLSGEVSTEVGAASGGEARDNTTEAAYWVSHRSGPFLVHKVGECEPKTIDNAGYLDEYEVAIEQGFAPCPKCI